MCWLPDWLIVWRGGLTIEGKPLTVVPSRVLGKPELEVVVGVLDRADLVLLVDKVSGTLRVSGVVTVQNEGAETTNPSSVRSEGKTGSSGRPDQRRRNMLVYLSGWGSLA